MSRLKRYLRLSKRIDEGVTTAGFGLGLFVFLFMGSLILSTATKLPTGSLFLDMLLWTGALLMAGWLVVKLARYLRAETHGNEPPSEPMTTQDLLGGAMAAIAGPLLLHWFAPRLLELRPDNWHELWNELRARWVDAALILAGLLLISWPIRAFVRYVTRR
jgi:hypothetical protein